MLGDFLEISISTPEILTSVEFYERLGFRHAHVGETWQHPYGVMSDGRVALGLHQYTFSSPALTFVVPELRDKLGSFAEAGIEFAFCKIADDEFNEVGFTDPDRQMITLLEARTFSPLPTGTRDSICGYFLEYRMGVRDCQVSRDFWERVGLVTASASPDQATYVQLARSGLNLGLQQRRPDRPPQLVFIHEQPEMLLPLLEARGIPFSRDADHDAAGLIRIETPDGLELLIRDRD
jgi:hypothetical protein